MKRVREYIDCLPATEKTSQSSVKAASKPKSASKNSKTSTCRISKTSSQRQRENLITQHRREEIELQNESMLHVAQQKQERDLWQLKQEEVRVKNKQGLTLAQLEEENRRRLAEAPLAELELSEDVSETSQSLRHAMSELSTHSQSVKSVNQNNWVTNTTTEVENELTQVQDSKVEKETRPRSITGVRSDVANEIGRPNTTPPFISVPNLTNWNQLSINLSQYSVQPNTTQP